MFGLDNKSGINVMPPIAPADSQTPLWFTEGGAGLSATYPGQDWFNQIQAELLNVLKAADIAPQKGSLNQLSSAISKLASAYALSVVQATGQSLTSVMSQKAVTDEQDKKFDKTGGVVTGEITSTGITRAQGASTIEINPNDTRPRLTSKVGKEGEWNSSYLPQKTGTIAHLDDIPAKTSIVQELGQSLTSVISQKGVTDALGTHGIGYGQQYINMTSSRQPGSWYPNNTGRPIFIIVSIGRDASGGTEQSAANVSFQEGANVISIPIIRGANSGGAQRGAGSVLIPADAIYTITPEFGSEIRTWWELR